MSILYLLVPIALFLGAAFVAAFAWGAAKGQFDDLKTPAHRILVPDPLDKGKP